jgi:hypothetical protein
MVTLPRDTDTVVLPPGDGHSGTRGPLVLRVQGTRHDGRILKLAAAKCAIGSGPQATLRLRGRGIRPVELLLVRGRAGTVARSWGPAARLNGRRFEAAQISPGDRLSVGPVDLEVVACPATGGSYESPQGGARFAAQAPAAGATPRSSKAARQRSRRLLTVLRDTRRELAAAKADAAVGAAEGQRLTGLLLTAQAELERLRTERQAEHQQAASTRLEQDRAATCERLELDALRAELNAARTELDSRQAELSRRESAAAEALAARNEDLSARERALGLAQAEADRQQMAVVERQEQLDLRREELEQRQRDLEERSAQLDQQQEQQRQQAEELETSAAAAARAATETRALEDARRKLGDDQATFEAQRLDWESQRAEREARIREEKGQLEAEAERLEALARRLEAEQEELYRRQDAFSRRPAPGRQDIEDEEGSPPRAGAIASGQDEDDVEDDEVFSRLQTLSLLKEPADEAEPDLAANRTPAGHGSGGPAATLRVTPSPAEEEDEEESIQAYMNRLLQRVRGDAPPAASRPGPSAPLHSPTTYRPAPSHVGVSSLDRQTQVGKPSPERAETLRRSLPPERSSDLAAMRELANQSAQSALETYAHRRWATAALGKVIVSVFGLIACLTLVAALPGWSALKIIGGGAALVIALFWGLQAGILVTQVRAARRRRRLALSTRAVNAAEGGETED